MRYIRIICAIFILLLAFSTAFSASLPGVIKVHAPTGIWTLLFPQEDWVLRQRMQRQEGLSHYYMFTDDVSGLIVSFFIEPATECSSSNECREFFWKNPGKGYNGATGFYRFEQNGFAIMKCIVPVKVGSIDFKQLNYSAHMVRDGYWIDMHLSKFPMEEGDEDLFLRFVRTINFKK